MQNTSDTENETFAKRGETQPTQPLSIPKARAVRQFLFALATDEGPQLLAFQMSNVLIGRLPDNHLSLNHGSVSRRHARISVTDRGVIIEDMGSQNGTTINGTPVKEPTPIRPGDVLRIGYVPMFYFGFMQAERPPEVRPVTTAVAVNPSAPPV